jgi:hypothetical protein
MQCHWAGYSCRLEGSWCLHRLRVVTCPATPHHSPEDSNPHFLHTFLNRLLLGVVSVDPDVKNVTCITAQESCRGISVFNIFAIYTAQHAFIFSVPYDRSAASFRAISPETAIQCFLFHFPVSSPFLKVTQ